MKAIQIDGYKKGEIKVTLREVDMPQVGDHDILVKVKAAAVNPLELLIAHGDVKLIVPYQFPLTLGNEMSGVVQKSKSLRKATEFLHAYQLIALELLPNTLQLTQVQLQKLPIIFPTLKHQLFHLQH